MLQSAHSQNLIKIAEASDYLSQMNLDINLLIEAVKEGHASRENTTELHPPTSAGFYAWSETNYGLSRRLKNLGWSHEVVSCNSPILKRTLNC